MTATPIVALDFPTAGAALSLVDRLGDACRFYKVGSELFCAEGPSIVSQLRARGNDVFLDLKFHDIPNTVRGAVASASALGVRLVTVHASGGRAMLEAAVAGAGDHCRVLAVSVLTSLGGAALGESWGRGDIDVESEVLRLARLSAHAGVHGLVCSGGEAAAVRRDLGSGLELLIPGIRFAESATHDQTRVVTPAAAVRAGATYLVLGRVVTAAPDPSEAMADARAEIASASTG